MVSTKPIKLIYIVGNGHSGSTLLDIFLGSHSQIESGGEIFTFSDFFSSKSQRNESKRFCTCGVHVEECDYWQKVRQQLNLNSRSFELDVDVEDLKEFEENNFKLISTILEISEKTIFCDSSKGFGRLKRFLKSKLFDVTVVHLVRDGRAVSFSRQKIVARRSGRPDAWNEYVTDYFKKLESWKSRNTRIYNRLNSDPRYLCIRYEDFVVNPRTKVTEILNKLNLEFEDQQLIFWKTVHHNLAGNRWRKQMNPGTPQTIQRDISYLENLPQHQWMLSNISASEELKLFGYSTARE
ncbi:MAG: sulfotransferase [Leptolyngbya sp. SIO1D8]|nr:sulfotransferase [Leptolyngbya sp. SIO1D8]